LGNVRVVVDRKDGSVQETRSYDPLGELMPDYCSQKAGTETQEKYSGKELDNEGSSIGVKGLDCIIMAHGIMTLSWGYGPRGIRWRVKI
jgi:hypothetical protein